MKSKCEYMNKVEETWIVAKLNQGEISPKIYRVKTLNVTRKWIN